jgi:hypothetical protein
MKIFTRPHFCLALLTFLMLIALSACAKPIYNVNNDQVLTPAGMTLEEAGFLIQAAGTERGWAMGIVAPGHIIGTLLIRSHSARVDIYYTTSSFSIAYKDSANLKYNPITNTIHHNYNTWVRNLERAIMVKLTNSNEVVDADN